MINIRIVSVLMLLLCCSALADDNVRVKTAALADIAIYPLRSAPATVISLNDTVVSAQISAKIEQIPVRVGDVVDAGILLVSVDCDDYILARRQAQARLEALAARIELATQRLQRTKKLTMNHSVSEEILDERKSALSVFRADHSGAEAAMEMAQLNISRCKVTSPFRALVTDRLASVGEYTTPGDALISIMDIDQLEISAQIFNQDVEQFVHVDALFFEYAGERYPVKLRTVLPTINTDTRNREVRLMFLDGPALPGAAGKLVWRDTRPHIPGDLLVRRSGQLGVFSTEQSIARFIAIPSAQAGRASPTLLPDTTTLIIEGHYALKDADAVSVAQ